MPAISAPGMAPMDMDDPSGKMMRFQAIKTRC